MKAKTKIELLKVTRNVEKKVGYKIPKVVVEDVLAVCLRKISCIKKDESYLPILYACELPLQLQIIAINEYCRLHK